MRRKASTSRGRPLISVTKRLSLIIGSIMQSKLRLAPARVEMEKRGGNIYLRSPDKLKPRARCVTEWLVQWSDKTPERAFLAERTAAGHWRKLTYRETYGA